MLRLFRVRVSGANEMARPQPRLAHKSALPLRRSTLLRCGALRSRALRRRLRCVRAGSTLLLFPHSLLDGRQFLQLVRRENRLDSRRAFLADLHDLLLLLLHAHRGVVAYGADLLVLVVDNLSDFLLLILRKVQLVFNRVRATLGRVGGSVAGCALAGRSALWSGAAGKWDELRGGLSRRGIGLGPVSVKPVAGSLHPAG